MDSINSDPHALVQTAYVRGDVFQITEAHGRVGWVGTFVLATEIRVWGIVGFVARLETHEKQARAYIRLPWNQLAYVGHAPLMPQDEVPDAEREFA